jgi:hypothetical protein
MIAGTVVFPTHSHYSDNLVAKVRFFKELNLIYGLKEVKCVGFGVKKGKYNRNI